jgi:predicted ATPase
MALTEKMGLATLSAAATTNHDAALIAQGRYEEGIAEMRRGVAAIRASGGTPNPSLLCNLASGLGRNGRPQEGLQVLEKAFVSVAKTGAQLHSPRLHRVKGELLLVQNPSNVAQAERCFRLTIEISQRQSYRSEELRAITNLARLLDEQGRRAEARKMLAEIYGWFTEGFDTRDLKDAKALLDELNE